MGTGEDKGNASNRRQVARRKKGGKKKKRISKHALKAQQAEKGQGGEGAAGDGSEEAAASLAKEGRSDPPPRNVKDPGEAASYLLAWKSQHNRPRDDDDDDGSLRSSSVGWKFNKNTQSWLVRHMYRPDMVNKSTFEVLTEYLSSMRGDANRSRVIDGAARRALRYREWEKRRGSGDGEGGGEAARAAGADGVTVGGNIDATVEDHGGECGEDDQAWSRLGDHEKRKEYKRARKVLQAMRGGSET